ncbi:prepilin peptidase [Streptococcus pantholopis]|uniref:Peptidase n=1 Tax=Streptococcus pantholopis TaxID=1811193 RepID=A0A172Q8J8_9STRE|nr:A24 family peptidase [Streptococcus pantholopis]AND79752.1 peptidase [Streptococcus pantholopis]
METFLYFFLGASTASFLGLIIERFPSESIIAPRSRCNSCGRILAVRDLIPLASQICNRFRCRFCESKIPIWYGLFEAGIGILFALWSKGVLTSEQLLLLIFSCTLSLYDLKEQAYPLLIWFCFTLPLLLFHSPSELTIIFLLIAIAASFISLRIGSGDFLYLATLTLNTDGQKILWIIQLASLSAIFFILFFHKRRKAIPFIPFLSAAYLLLTVWELLS